MVLSELITDIVSLGRTDEGAAGGEAEAPAKPLRLLADQAADLLVAVPNGHVIRGADRCPTTAGRSQSVPGRGRGRLRA